MKDEDITKTWISRFASSCSVIYWISPIFFVLLGSLLLRIHIFFLLINEVLFLILAGFEGIFKKSRICNTHNKHFYFTTFTYVEHPTLNSNLALTLLHAPCASRVFKWNAVLPSKVLYCFTAHCKNLAPQKWIWQQKAFLSMLCLSLGYFYFIRTNILLVNLN